MFDPTRDYQFADRRAGISRRLGFLKDASPDTFSGELHAQISRQCCWHHFSHRPRGSHHPAQGTPLDVRTRLRAGTTALLLLLGTAHIHAAGVDVTLDGLEEEQRDAVLATLQLAEYKKTNISAAELRAAYAQIDEQVKQALEPFGYYDVQVDKSLTGDAASGWKARIAVQRGEPAIVRRTTVEVVGEGKDQRRVKSAVENFEPKPGARLDHSTYEASKAVIETSLRGSGYLDAQALQKRVTVFADEHAVDVDLKYESGPRYKFGDVRFAGDAPFPESFLNAFVPWRDDAWFNSEQVLNLQQRLVDADYFELVSVQPALDEKKDGSVPIDVLLKRDQRTVYSGEVYYSTDFGGGVRVGASAAG